MKVATGSYTGDGADDRSISGLGFQPEVVLIKHGGTNGGSFVTDSFTVGEAGFWRDDAAFATDAIQALESDGFQIGTDGAVNTSSETYYWMALADGGDGDLSTGSYTGDGTDDRDITTPGFDVELVFIKGDTGTTGAWRHKSNDAGESLQFHEFGSEQTNQIQNFITNGFELGTAAQVNSDTVEYQYWAVKDGSSSIFTGTYTGDGNDDRSITGAGFEPEAAWTKRSASAPVANTTDTDSSWSFTFAGAAADRIQALEADGMQVGTSVEVNFSLSPYYWVAFRTAPAAPGGTQVKDIIQQGLIPGAR